MKIPQLKQGATGVLTRVSVTTKPNGEIVRRSDFKTPFTILEVRSKDFITCWEAKSATSRVYAELPKTSRKLPDFDTSNETRSYETSELTAYGFVKKLIYESNRKGQEYKETLIFTYYFNPQN